MWLWGQRLPEAQVPGTEPDTCSGRGHALLVLPHVFLLLGQYSATPEGGKTEGSGQL